MLLLPAVLGCAWARVKGQGRPTTFDYAIIIIRAAQFSPATSLSPSPPRRRLPAGGTSGWRCSHGRQACGSATRSAAHSAYKCPSASPALPSTLAFAAPPPSPPPSPYTPANHPTQWRSRCSRCARRRRAWPAAAWPPRALPRRCASPAPAWWWRRRRSPSAI